MTERKAISEWQWQCFLFACLVKKARVELFGHAQRVALHLLGSHRYMCFATGREIFFLKSF